MNAERLPTDLRRALLALAGTPQLLIACDYDGTLAPIVADPDRAWPRPESVTLVRTLATLPDTTIAVISGRARADLAALSGLPPEVVLVGSHGAEFNSGFTQKMGPSAQALRGSLLIELDRLTEGADGVVLEPKPASVAVHVRQAEPAVAERVLDAVADGPASWDGVTVTGGKAVVELAVVTTDKGSALDELRNRAEASAVVFIGDDLTDEKAFARLAESDLGIKVGPGQTLAEHRVCSPSDVTSILALLAEERERR